ncbi:hypothetical protein [Streptomyces sp. NPDC046859]|uniref:hypothetical protein n=1 Tax=Streptomyces sp. NPDC046859 TaxID=3155734 RepID=UPI0033F6882E
MAFGAEELRVLRRALALALHAGPASAEDVHDCLHLAESLDEAIREGARQRAFLLDDLARYRAALPGSATGYLALLAEALDAGHRPTADDLAALGALRGNRVAAALLARCRPQAATDVVALLPRPAATPAAPARPLIPASRARLQALPGGLQDAAVTLPAQSAGDEPAKPARKRPAEKPATPAPAPGREPAAPKPDRPIPTPGEVFPRRKPAPPATAPPQQLAAG